MLIKYYSIYERKSLDFRKNFFNIYSMTIKRFNEFLDEHLNESLPQQHSIDQLKMVRKLSKGIDIGDRITNLEDEGANIQFYRNAIDSGVESFQDYDTVTKWRDFADVTNITNKTKVKTIKNKGKK